MPRPAGSCQVLHWSSRSCYKGWWWHQSKLGGQVGHQTPLCGTSVQASDASCDEQPDRLRVCHGLPSAAWEVGAPASRPQCTARGCRCPSGGQAKASVSPLSGKWGLRPDLQSLSASQGHTLSLRGIRKAGHLSGRHVQGRPWAAKRSRAAGVTLARAAAKVSAFRAPPSRSSGGSSMLLCAWAPSLLPYACALELGSC